MPVSPRPELVSRFIISVSLVVLICATLGRRAAGSNSSTALLNINGVEVECDTRGDGNRHCLIQQFVAASYERYPYYIDLVDLRLTAETNSGWVKPDCGFLSPFRVQLLAQQAAGIILEVTEDEQTTSISTTSEAALDALRTGKNWHDPRITWDNPDGWCLDVVEDPVVAECRLEHKNEIQPDGGTKMRWPDMYDSCGLDDCMTWAGYFRRTENNGSEQVVHSRRTAYGKNPGNLSRSRTWLAIPQEATPSDPSIPVFQLTTLPPLNVTRLEHQLYRFFKEDLLLHLGLPSVVVDSVVEHDDSMKRSISRAGNTNTNTSSYSISTFHFVGGEATTYGTIMRVAVHNPARHRTLLRALAPATGIDEVEKENEEKSNMLIPLLLTALGTGLSLFCVIVSLMARRHHRGGRKQRVKSKNIEAQSEDGLGDCADEGDDADDQTRDSAAPYQRFTVNRNHTGSAAAVDPSYPPPPPLSDVVVVAVFEGIVTHSRITLPLRKGTRGRLLQNFINSAYAPAELVEQYSALSEEQVIELVKLLRIAQPCDDDTVTDLHGNVLVHLDSVNARFPLVPAPEKESHISTTKARPIVNPKWSDHVDVEEVYQGVVAHSRMMLPLRKGKRGWLYLQRFLNSTDAPAELVEQYRGLCEEQLSELLTLLRKPEVTGDEEDNNEYNGVPLRGGQQRDDDVFPLERAEDVDNL